MGGLYDKILKAQREAEERERVNIASQQAIRQRLKDQKQEDINRIALGILKVAFVIIVSGLFLVWVHSWHMNEISFGLPRRTPEMIARSNSTDPYPQYTTVYPGTSHYFNANDTCKYQGVLYWRVKSKKRVNIIEKLIGDGTYAIITSDRKCKVELSNIPF